MWRADTVSQKESLRPIHSTDTLLEDRNLYRCFGYSLMTPKRFSKASVAIGSFLIKNPEQEGSMLIINSPEDCLSKDDAINKAKTISTAIIGNNSFLDDQIINTPIGSCLMYLIDESIQMLILGILYDEINCQIMTISLFYSKGAEPDYIVEEYISVLKSIKVL